MRNWKKTEEAKSLFVKNLDDLVSSRGGILYDREWRGAAAKYRISCSDGHFWEMSSNVLRQGCWCPICARKKLGRYKHHPHNQTEKKKAQWMAKLLLAVQAQGGVLHDLEWRGSKWKYLVSCSLGHQWRATSGNLEYGFWCPECSGVRRADSRRGSLEGCINYAKTKGGVCESACYVNSITRLSWRCAQGHRWQASFGSMVSKNSWCSACAGNRPKTIERCQEIAVERGGLCLSESYKNESFHLLWECGKGHRWEATYGNIGHSKNPTWCPFCVKQSSRVEVEIYNLVKGDFPNAVHRARRLLADKRFELDVYVPSIKKAIEFDGDYWHGMKGAPERDARKDVQCVVAGICLLRVKERDWVLNKEQEIVRIKRHLSS